MEKFSEVLAEYLDARERLQEAQSESGDYGRMNREHCIDAMADAAARMDEMIKPSEDA